MRWIALAALLLALPAQGWEACGQCIHPLFLQHPTALEIDCAEGPSLLLRGCLNAKVRRNKQTGAVTIQCDDGAVHTLSP